MKQYRTRLYELAILFLVILLPTIAQAKNTEQHCNISDYRTIANYLRKPLEKLTPLIIDSACAPVGLRIGTKILVAAIPRDEKSSDPDLPSNDLIILILDESGRITSSYRADTGEDAGLLLEKGSIRIDLARYNVSDDARLFGIDLTSGYIPHCNDGGFGAIRTLYRTNGQKVQPVLSEFFVSEWIFIHEPYGRCNTNKKAGDLTILEEFDKTISVSSEKSNGFKDLIVRGTARVHYIPASGKEYFRPSKRPPFEFHLHFDGQKYDTKKLEVEWDRWRS